MQSLLSNRVGQAAVLPARNASSTRMVVARAVSAPVKSTLNTTRSAEVRQPPNWTWSRQRCPNAHQ